MLRLAFVAAVACAMVAFAMVVFAVVGAAGVAMVALFSVSANCYVLFLRQLRCVAEIVGSLGGIGGVGDLVGLDFCDLSCSLYRLRIWQQLQIVALGCRWCRSLSWWTRCLSHSVGGAAEKDAVAAEAVEALCVGAGSSEIKRLSDIGSGGGRRLC